MTYHLQHAGLGALGVGQGVAPGVANETQRAFARELYEAGLRFFDQGDYAASLARFTEAYNTVAHPTVLVAIGAAMIKLERYQDAKYRFQRYLREEPDGELAPRARSQIEYIDYVLGERERVASMGPGTKPAETSPEYEFVVTSRETRSTPAPAPPPTAAEVYDDETPTIAVWVVTGLGVLALAGAGYYLVQRQRRRPKPNRRRRRTSRRR